MRRRAFLATCAAVGVGVAGCLGDGASTGTTAAPDTSSESSTGEPGPDTATRPGTAAPGDTDAAVGTATADGVATDRPSTAAESTDRETASSTSTPPPALADYETTAVRMTTPDGEVLASVTAAIADTSDLRYTGLSDTAHLPEDRGMLFVYDEVGDHTYVMRRMDFGIDIVYADDEGVITSIHHAPAPGPNEDGNDQRYPGRGQYVLEVNYEFTTEHGVEEGDVLEFEL